jgi:hypothetical protein
MTKYTPISLIEKFSLFVSHSQAGKRRTKSGARFAKRTIENYVSSLKLFRDFEKARNKEILIPIYKGKSTKEHWQIRNYWRKLERDMRLHFASKNLCHNTCGIHIKILKTFCNWLKNEQGYPIGDFYKGINSINEDIPILTLDMERMKSMIKHSIEMDLPPPHQKWNDLFVFGCTVGLRYGDLKTLKMCHLQVYEGLKYLVVSSSKNGTITKVSLPSYAQLIIERWKIKGIRKDNILPYPSLSNFNIHCKLLGEHLGWKEIIGKKRMVNFKYKEVKYSRTNKSYRFCDLMASHMMRKTAITLMLMNGIPEHLVRRISGHAPTSPEFYKYVNYIQSFTNDATEKHFAVLMA